LTRLAHHAGKEPRNAKRDILRAVLLSLAIQRCLCCFFEYFAATYLMHNGYTMPMAAGSCAPVAGMSKREPFIALVVSAARGHLQSDLLQDARRQDEQTCFPGGEASLVRG
jgi:hypothetical protein